MRTEEQFQRAWARTEAWIRVHAVLTRYDSWCFRLAFAVFVLAVPQPGRLFGFVVLQFVFPLVFLGLCIMGVWIIVTGAVLMYRDRLLAERWRMLGCTCIPGALTDNPSCPHHRQRGLR